MFPENGFPVDGSMMIVPAPPGVLLAQMPPGRKAAKFPFRISAVGCWLLMLLACERRNPS